MKNVTLINTVAVITLALTGVPLLKAAPSCDPIVMYGGNFETWTWSGKAWTQKTTSVGPFQPGVMAYDKIKRQVVMLTWGASGSWETWAWDGNDWTQRFPLVSPPDNFGVGTNMVYDIARQEMLVQGEAWDAGYGPIAATWIYKDDNWTRKFPATDIKTVYGGTMSYDSDTKKTIWFGGWEFGAHYGTSGTAQWDGTNWSYPPLKNGTWTKPTHPDNMLGYASSAYDPSRHQLLEISNRVMAGMPNNYAVNETWLWKGTSWTQVFPKVSLLPHASQIAYDAGDHTTVAYLPPNSSNPLPQTWAWNGSNWKNVTPANQPSTQTSYYIMSSNAIAKTCPGGRD